jgi:hypothetical protein
MLLAALDVATDSGTPTPSPQAVKATTARDVAAEARRSAETVMVTRYSKRRTAAFSRDFRVHYGWCAR